MSDCIVAIITMAVEYRFAGMSGLHELANGCSLLEKGK
jgi:hypothetical protein